jgi:hypothetical protein
MPPFSPLSIRREAFVYPALCEEEKTSDGNISKASEVSMAVIYFQKHFRAPEQFSQKFALFVDARS